MVTHDSGTGCCSNKQIVMITHMFKVAIVTVTYGFSMIERHWVFTPGIWCFSGFSSLSLSVSRRFSGKY